MGKQLRIKNFEYNGFCGRVLEGFAPYTGEFVSWTNDPGIAVIKCSDGKKRTVPAYAIDAPPEELPAMPDYKAMKEKGEMLYFGIPSFS